MNGLTPHTRLRTWLDGRVGRRADRTYRVRLIVQVSFAAVCVLMGAQFVRFVTAARIGALPLPDRPAGVDAFLPISGLMGLLDWAYQGTLNVVHPSATVLVVIAVGMAFALRKSFCSWVCPVGFLSELLARLGRRSFGRNFLPWRWVDVPLRSLKWVLLAFFLGSIVLMSPAALSAFLDSPYNRVADVKMGLFFTDMGRVGLTVMGTLLIGSVVVRGPWCRYLCPYGALLGVASRISPARIRRDPAACVACGLCDRACMARLPVSSAAQVVSVECTGCLDCVAVCPRADALGMYVGRRRVRPVTWAAAIVGLFAAAWLGARAAGAWHSGIDDQEYVERIRDIHSPEYGHPGIDGPSAGSGVPAAPQ